MATVTIKLDTYEKALDAYIKVPEYRAKFKDVLEFVEMCYDEGLEIEYQAFGVINKYVPKSNIKPINFCIGTCPRSKDEKTCISQYFSYYILVKFSFNSGIILENRENCNDWYVNYLLNNYDYTKKEFNENITPNVIAVCNLTKGYRLIAISQMIKYFDGDMLIDLLSKIPYGPFQESFSMLMDKAVNNRAKEHNKDLLKFFLNRTSNNLFNDDFTKLRIGKTNTDASLEDEFYFVNSDIDMDFIKDVLIKYYKSDETQSKLVKKFFNVLENNIESIESSKTTEPVTESTESTESIESTESTETTETTESTESIESTESTETTETTETTKLDDGEVPELLECLIIDDVKIFYKCLENGKKEDDIDIHTEIRPDCYDEKVLYDDLKEFMVKAQGSSLQFDIETIYADLIDKVDSFDLQVSIVFYKLFENILNQNRLFKELVLDYHILKVSTLHNINMFKFLVKYDKNKALKIVKRMVNNIAYGISSYEVTKNIISNTTV